MRIITSLAVAGALLAGVVAEAAASSAEGSADRRVAADAQESPALFERWPVCEYRRLGKVQGSSGRIHPINNFGGVIEVEKRARPGEAMAMLLEQARELGANAVVLTRRESFSFQPEPGSSMRHRRDSGELLEGAAIRIDGDPGARECLVAPLKHKAERSGG